MIDYIKELEKANNEIKLLKRLLSEASNDILDWGGYASNYFQDKYNLDADCKKYMDASNGIYEVKND